MTMLHFSISRYSKFVVRIILLGSMGLLAFAGNAYAEPVSFNYPAQPLSQALKEYAKSVGATIAVDSQLVNGKTAPVLKGSYEPEQALRQLLEGSGLHAITQGNNIVIERRPVLPSAENLKKNPSELPDVDLKLDVVQVRSKRYQNVGPMPGLSLTKDQIAGNIQSISAKEIKEAHSLSLSDLLNSKLQSINVNDYQGNPFQMDVTYRGFTASPQIGSPQGLSVFFDGIRVNEAFGDIVNWDMIPMNALAGFDLIPGSNPLYGLNTLGGALTMKTKSGFDSPGISGDVLTGSFGRKQFQGSAGWNNGTLAAFGSVNVFMEDGWRQNSPSKVNQAFGKVEWQGEKLSLGLSSLAVVNKLVGNGTVPQELYREDPTAVFTSPDETNNRLLQFQITAAFDFNEQINLTGQIYNRDSNRKSNTGDVIDRETFYGNRDNYRPIASRRAAPGEQIACALGDTNKDGIPDYYLIPEADTTAFMINNPNFFQGVVPVQTGLNAALPAEVVANLKNVFRAGLIDAYLNYGPGPDPVYPISGNVISFTRGPQAGFTFTDAGTTYRMFAAPPVNLANCVGDSNGFKGGNPAQLDLLAGIISEPQRARDGAGNPAYSGTFGSGVVEGTPTAVITKSNIQQSGQGAAAQLNFNFDQHKAMVGISIDRARSSYVGKQRFGQIDNNRNVYNDPNSLGAEYYAADHDITINDFAGKSSTRSVYASETWSPVKTLNISVSGRYNYTNIKNVLAPKLANSDLDRLNNQFAVFMICPGNDTSNCPYSLGSPIDFAEFYKTNPDPFGNGSLSLSANQLDKKQTEKFSYHSLNPSIGVTWQARPNLNIYGNWNQGTRAPSVIELGCAYDDTLVPLTNSPGSELVPRSIRDKRGCSLPSALSGDPYLPQVVAKTIEGGARGKFKDFLEWNISAYRTEVTDDIYLTALTPELSFFQSIGDTRRQGIEFGMAGEYGRSDFRINYSLTEATFQSDFRTFSPNNSTAGQDVNVKSSYSQIDVKKGNVMPGVPFNNMNFNWGYKVTRDLKVNLGLVAHSGSFLRGNENNAHTPTQGRTITSVSGQTVVLPDNEYAGTAPGYAVLNFSARYNLGSGWAASLRINNLLDKTYYTAGRLGINPFAPSTIGAIGPGGFNFNSNEWIPSQFISAGAPRGIWGSLSYDFDAAKKYEASASTTSMVDPDRTLDKPDNFPTQDEIALMKQMESIKALPVLNRTLTSTQVAKLEVTASVDAWRKAQLESNAEAYLRTYSPGYAPPGNSHNNWAEQQKLQVTTDSIQAAEVTDLMVGPQGKRMVAVFMHKSTRGHKQLIARKVLTFEQKDGHWQITRESALPAYIVDVKDSATILGTKAKSEVNNNMINPGLQKNSINTDTAFVEVAK